MLEDLDKLARTYIKSRDPFIDGQIGNPFTLFCEHNCAGYERYMAGLARGFHYGQLISEIDDENTIIVIARDLENQNKITEKMKKVLKCIVKRNPFTWDYSLIAKLIMQVIDHCARFADHAGIAFAKKLMIELMNQITVEYYNSDSDFEN